MRSLKQLALQACSPSPAISASTKASIFSGSFAVQIAKAKGAKVIATASTANQDFLKQLGADVAVDYTKTKFEDVAKDVV